VAGIGGAAGSAGVWHPGILVDAGPKAHPGVGVAGHDPRAHLVGIAARSDWQCVESVRLNELVPGPISLLPLALPMGLPAASRPLIITSTWDPEGAETARMSLG
jgi:hypothetical protein